MTPKKEYVRPGVRQSLTLPMHMRRVNPMGYTHGQINHQGIKHPGYDLNDGANAWADLGQELYAPGDARIIFSNVAAGWGTLMVGYLSEKVLDPVTGKPIHIGFRLGHPQRLLYKVGARVKEGEVIATCGNGGIKSMTPHLHYDLFRRDVFERLGREFAAKHGQREADRVCMPFAYWDRKSPLRDHFEELYLDPAEYHPEIRALGF